MSLLFRPRRGLVVLLLLSLPILAFARPVSYPGGWTLMQFNSAPAYSVHAHYSPSARYSVGYRVHYNRHKDTSWSFSGLQVNYLPYRNNQPSAQTNLYLKTGIGSVGVGPRTLNDWPALDAVAGFVGIAIDWETRRYFTSYENRLYHSRLLPTRFSHQARFGAAPYIGNTGDWHTWLILQILDDPNAEQRQTYSFIVRFFKGPFLGELGLDTGETARFNWIYRF